MDMKIGTDFIITKYQHKGGVVDSSYNRMIFKLVSIGPRCVLAEVAWAHCYSTWPKGKLFQFRLDEIDTERPNDKYLETAGIEVKENVMDCDNFKAKEDQWSTTVGELKLLEKADVKGLGVGIRQLDKAGKKNLVAMGFWGSDDWHFVGCNTPCKRLGHYEYVPKGEGFMRGTDIESDGNGHFYFTDLTLCHSTNTIEIPPRPKYDKTAGGCAYEGVTTWYEFSPEAVDHTGNPLGLGFFTRIAKSVHSGGYIKFRDTASVTWYISIMTPCREVPAPNRFSKRVDEVEVHDVVEFPEDARSASDHTMKLGRWVCYRRGESFRHQESNECRTLHANVLCDIVGKMVNEKKFVPKE